MAFFVCAYLIQALAWAAGFLVAVDHRRKYGMIGFGVLAVANLAQTFGALSAHFNALQAVGVALTAAVSFTMVTGYITLVERSK